MGRAKEERGEAQISHQSSRADRITGRRQRTTQETSENNQDISSRRQSKKREMELRRQTGASREHRGWIVRSDRVRSE